MQVVWLCIRYLKEEKMRRAREDCQPKVIYLDNATDPELTMFMFDHEGNVVKVSFRYLKTRFLSAWYSLSSNIWRGK